MKRGNRLFKHTYPISIPLLFCLVIYLGGCAAIIRGTSQTCRVVTNPPGQSIMYNGVQISDGDQITIQKHFAPTMVGIQGADRVSLQHLQYDPDPLIICDAALLLIGVVPGIVALSVDFGTGAWRDHHDPQVLYISTSSTSESAENSAVVTVHSEGGGNGPPPWAPAPGMNTKFKYRYYPGTSVYYDMDRRLYFYMHNGEWMTCMSLPGEMAVNSSEFVYLEMDTATPYKFHVDVIGKYPPGQTKKYAKGQFKNK